MYSFTAAWEKILGEMVVKVLTRQTEKKTCDNNAINLPQSCLWGIDFVSVIGTMTRWVWSEEWRAIDEGCNKEQCHMNLRMMSCATKKSSPFACSWPLDVATSHGYGVLVTSFFLSFGIWPGEH